MVKIWLNGKVTRNKQAIKVIISLIALLIVIVTTGCADGQVDTTINKEQGIESANGYQVIDTQGQVVHLAKKPTRVVSLALSSDEILLAMVPPEKMLALHYLADDPGISTIAEKASCVPVRLREYDAEKIIALNPDLVIAPDWNRADLIQTLRDMGLTVFVSKGPSSVKEVKQAIQEISQAIGEESAGLALIAQMEAELADIEIKANTIPTAKRQTLLLISHMAAYGGKGSLFDDLCNYAGVINGAAVAGLGKNSAMSKECIISINPDLILVPSWTGGKLDVNQVKKDLEEDPALQTVSAIKNKRLLQVSDASLYCASQDVVKAIREIMMVAYPEYSK